MQGSKAILTRNGAGGDLEITGLTADSRAVEPGYLFAALPGTRTDGARFIADALTRGAVAVLAPEGVAPPEAANDVALLTETNPRRAFARMAASFYADQPETLVAVTGTNGKSSVAHFADQLWRALGHPSGSMGTLGIRSAAFDRDGTLTTADPVALHKDLADLAHAGITHLALEASSHGLAQYRLDGVRLKAAAFTNLSRDHLDYHGDMASYFAAKARLFGELLPAGATAVLNAEDPRFHALANICNGQGIEVLDYGHGARRLAWRASELLPDGQRLRFAWEGAAQEVGLNLYGDFQAGNVLAALGLVLATRPGGSHAPVSAADWDALRLALRALTPVKGRLQPVIGFANGARAYVDYAHTPDALATALKALRPHCAGRLIVVFGCGGARDTGKRPQMGAIAAAAADAVIVTDDNPRSEDPAAIRAAILAAAPDALEIGDRRAAIARGLDMLDDGDCLLIAGKGHETGQIVGDRVLPFDDTGIARELGRARGGKALA
jgi:UDP-N-acetylmuramoyl-L-alanyl-D-glutamate--2,6-diaminopimelate ligase